MTSASTSRVDMHCHSSASQVAKLGVSRSLGLPECATPPEEVYELAKRRGMDFVTITDHDSISGVLDIADSPDVFISEELTVSFRGEPQAVHVLCYGITPDDHEWLQRHAGDVEACAEYLHGNGIACALAHPFFAVAAPLAPRHRRRLARLFPVWETRNGARARELNMPAAIYIETHGGTGIAGSDDHAGVDIGRTYTVTPRAATPEEFLAHLRHGQADACGDQGSAAKWTHSAIALAARVLDPHTAAAPNPAAVLSMVERVVREGEMRGGAVGRDLGPDDAGAVLESWLTSVGVEARGRELIDWFQSEDFSHADLYRRARRAHERRLTGAVDEVLRATAAGEGHGAAALGLFAACIPAIPYAPAAAFLGQEKARLVTRENEPPRVALVADAIGQMNGVTHTIDEIRERGVPGVEVDVIGTDPSADRRLSAVAEVDIPFYPGLRVGIPSLPGLVETLTEGRYDALHVTSPGPAAVAAVLVARAMGIPTVGSYHTELSAYAALRSGDGRVEAGMDAALAAFYGQCRVVLSPSPSADASLGRLGVEPSRVVRWDRGVDLARFGPEHREEGRFPGEVNVLYAGRLTTEKGVDLLADAFLTAREKKPGLHLVLAGGGPEEKTLRDRLGPAGTFLGWLEDEELARAYASADLFLFASRTDTFGQVILEAQASGLPVIAVDEGGPTSLIEDEATGLLRPPHAGILAHAVLDLAAAPGRRARLARTAAGRLRERSWERSLATLAGGYRQALEGERSTFERRAA
jgi:glycosyltransferase involved in cell wall biosynthesis/predicted metal-dependent phosphoesterase TrpH